MNQLTRFLLSVLDRNMRLLTLLIFVLCEIGIIEKKRKKSERVNGFWFYHHSAVFYLHIIINSDWILVNEESKQQLKQPKRLNAASTQHWFNTESILDLLLNVLRITNKPKTVWFCFQTGVTKLIQILFYVKSVRNMPSSMTKKTNWCKVISLRPLRKEWCNNGY